MQAHDHHEQIIQLVVDSNVVAFLHLINQYNIQSAWFDVGCGGCQKQQSNRPLAIQDPHFLCQFIQPITLHTRYLFMK
jgi:hypothetical protein